MFKTELCATIDESGEAIGRLTNKYITNGR